MSDQTLERRSRFRFSLWTMLLVVTIAAPISLGAKWLLRDAKADVEAKAVAHLVNTTRLRPDQLRGEAFPDRDAWTVYVYFVPPTPDAMWTLRVSASGEVLDVR